MANPSRHHLAHPLTLEQLKKLKNWHVAQRGAHAVEYEVWNAVLTAWLMGWIGFLPALTFDAFWALPFCVLGVLAPQLYVHARVCAHANGRLRCDWLMLLS